MPVQSYLSDFSLNASASSLAGRIDLATVRLFKNSWVPTNNMNLGSFSECTFAGYAPLPLAGLSLGVRQLSVGVWETRFQPVFFNWTGGPSQFVNGWFLTDALNNVLGATPISPPKQIFGASGSIRVAVALQVRGLNLPCP